MFSYFFPMLFHPGDPFKPELWSSEKPIDTQVRRALYLMAALTADTCSAVGQTVFVIGNVSLTLQTNSKNDLFNVFN